MDVWNIQLIYYPLYEGDVGTTLSFPSVEKAERANIGDGIVYQIDNFGNKSQVTATKRSK